MRKFLVLAASTAAILASPALADDHDDDSGFYLRGNAGWGILEGELDGGLFGPHNDAEVQGEGDVAGSLGIGYEFGDDSKFSGFRIELDGDSLYSNLGQIGNVDGSFAKLHTDSAMVNVLYDFSSDSKFQPYIGVGAGLVQGKVSALASDVAGVNGGVVNSQACLGDIFGTCSAFDKDTTWGAQGILGLGVEVADNLFWDTHGTVMMIDAGGFDIEGQFDPLFADRAPMNSFVHDIEMDNVIGASLMTGLRYKFGGREVAPPPPPPPVADFECWDGKMVFNSSQCAPKPVVEETPPPPPPPSYTCWDNQTIVYDLANCPAQPAPAPTYVCDDGTIVSDQAYCQPVQTIVQRYNNCGPSNVAIFNVPVGSTPKTISRLGTMPEFGDSHGLTPTQFFEKLQSRYNSSATDKAYLNYLFKSMGYSNGFADANEFMFSEEVLDVGTSGLLGLGEVHHYEYSVLPSSDRDRQAFRIQSANGSVVHFMKTCGNYFYACN